jgi:hypothetical protein
MSNLVSHRLRLVVAWTVLVGGCASRPNEQDPASLQLCTEMRDHLVELRLASAAGVELAPHREALKRALGADFLNACVAKWTVGQARCVIAAADSTAAGACSAPITH